jgi:hypothetical protein
MALIQVTNPNIKNSTPMISIEIKLSLLLKEPGAINVLFAFIKYILGSCTSSKQPLALVEPLLPQPGIILGYWRATYFLTSDPLTA